MSREGAEAFSSAPRARFTMCRQCGRRSATARSRAVVRDASESLAQRSLRVGGERPHRRDPEHADCVIRVRCFARRQARRRTRPPASCPIRSWRGGARIGPRHEPPGLALKRKDCPASASEPASTAALRSTGLPGGAAGRRRARAGSTVASSCCSGRHIALQGEPQHEGWAAKPPGALLGIDLRGLHGNRRDPDRGAVAAPAVSDWGSVERR